MKRYGYVTLIMVGLCIIIFMGVPASATVELQGSDTDGDVYQIKLSSSGTIIDPNLTSLTLSGTTLSSALSVTVLVTIGDGKVNVASLNTSGRKLGKLTIEGDLSNLQCGEIKTLEVETIGAISGTNTISIDGDVTSFKVPGGIANATISVVGNVHNMKVGTAADTGSVISHSQITLDGDVQLLSIEQSLTAGSTLNISGELTNAIIGDSIVNSTFSVGGAVSNVRISGGITRTSTLGFAGTCKNLMVSRSVSDAQITVGSKLSIARIDTDLVDSVLTINELDKLIVGDDLNNTRIRVSGDLKKLQAGDIHLLTLGVSGKLGQFQIKNDLDRSTVFSLDTIDDVAIKGDMNRSTIVAGIDLGDDLTQAPGDQEWGNAWINGVQIGGDMIDSNISAGVNASAPNYQYGDGNDVAVDNHEGTSRILSIKVRGQIKSTQLPGETYAISADDGVDKITADGKPFTGVPGVDLQEF